MAKEDLKTSQRNVNIGVVVGLTLTCALAGFLWFGLEDHYFVIPDRQILLDERLAYAAKWTLLPAMCIILGIGKIAYQRYFSDAIDPTVQVNNRKLTIWRQYTQNTFEQAFLYVIGAAAFAPITPQYWLRLIPIIAILFVVGRILFAIGYLINPSYRSPGFGMTFYPIVLLYGMSIYFYIQ